MLIGKVIFLASCVALYQARSSSYNEVDDGTPCATKLRAVVSGLPFELSGSIVAFHGCLNGFRLSERFAVGTWIGRRSGGFGRDFAHIQPDTATGGSSNTYQEQPFTTYSRFSTFTAFYLVPAQATAINVGHLHSFRNERRNCTQRNSITRSLPVHQQHFDQFKSGCC
jgi:hypothetical protein